MNPTGQLSIEALDTITLYIYKKEMNPHAQSSIDALHTGTPNQFNCYI